MAEQIIHRPAAFWAEIEIAALGVAGQDASSLERAADAFGYTLEEHLQLRQARRSDPTKHRPTAC